MTEDWGAPMNEEAKALRRDQRRETGAAVPAYRCPMTWNPGSWPYVARCVGDVRIPHSTHVDRDGNVHQSLPVVGTELPLRVFQTGDDGVALICTLAHDGTPCGRVWSVSNPLNAPARFRDAREHVRPYLAQARALSVGSTTDSGATRG